MEDKAKNIAIPMRRSAILILGTAFLGILRVGLVWCAMIIVAEWYRSIIIVKMRREVSRKYMMSFPYTD